MLATLNSRIWLFSVVFLATGIANFNALAQNKQSRKTSRTQKVTVKKSEANDASKRHQFISPDNSFSVTSPAKLNGKKDNSDVFGLYIGSSPEGIWQISSSSLNTSPSDDQLEEETVQEMILGLRQAGQKVISVNRIAQDIVDLETNAMVTLENKLVYNRHGIARLIVRNGNLYNLSCASGTGGKKDLTEIIKHLNKEPDRVICRQFFESFRFLE